MAKQADDEPEQDDDQAEDGEQDDPEEEWEAGGQKYKVKKSELRSGYMKDADYRRKTAEVAEQRRQVEAFAQQVVQGAPADVFISADLAWMDYLTEKKLIKDDTRANLLGNRIVLVSGKKDAGPVEIKQGFDLAGILGDGRLAMGAVDSVPAGKYGKAALEKLDAWKAVEPKVAGAESVRAALLLVSRGEAPYGIVYQTDAAADPGVKVVGTFPEDSHPPIIYPIAITAESKSPDAAAYVDFVKSAKAAELFEKQGFTVLK